MTKYIGFSGQAGAGKSTAALMMLNVLSARYVCDMEVRSFAFPMRQMVDALLVCCGISNAERKRYLNRDKSEVIPVVGQSARHLLQTIGDEWGRNLVHIDLWVRIGMCNTTHDGYEYDWIIFDDVRYESEARAIREAGGLVVHMKRPVGPRMSHPSEAGIAYVAGDMVINTNDMQEVLDAVIEIINTI